MKKNTPTSKTRKFLILKRLLNGEHLSYQHLADDYFVSRSSIANDIVYIKRLLAEDNTPLEFDNSGSYLKCKEIKRQDIIKRVISKLNQEKNSDAKKLFLDEELYENVKSSLTGVENACSLRISDLYIENVVLIITILIQRGRKGHHIESFNMKDLLKIQSLKNYPIVSQLLQSVGEENSYQFNDNELRYLSYIILANGINFLMKDELIPEVINKQVNKLVKDVGNGLSSNFANDQQLIKDLSLHIYQMLLRLKTHTTVINPILVDIKISYPKTYGVVWYFLNNFALENNLQISDDEIGFITIHFQAALERKKTNKKILFVCPHGIGTSSLASAQLKRILPTNAIIKTAAVIDLADRNLKDTDLIVSTVPLPQMKIPVVKISPLLTKNDLKNVMDKYIDTTILDDQKEEHDKLNLSQKVVNLLKHHISFFKDEKLPTIIDQLLDFNDWDSDEQKNCYLNTVNNRESLQSTYLGNGIAIPHGDPKMITNSCIAVAILNRPLNWGNNKTDIICLLMIADQDKKTIEPFMSLIMKGIKDKEWFIKKMTEFE